MAIPVDDGLMIGLWCKEQAPAGADGAVRIECEISDRHVTIFEARAAWNGPEWRWTQTPVARLRHTGTTGLWSLYCSDRNGRFHAYKDHEPVASVRVLLDHIAHSGDPIFWG